jgi:DNA-binding NtrC family response regulator
MAATDKPILYWIEMQVSASTAAQSACFEPFCDIRHAADAVADRAESLRVDVVCLDFDAPDMAQLRLIRQVKRRFPSAPVLMLTLQHSEELAVWAFRAGVFDYLIKPLRMSEVQRSMERVLVALAARRSQDQRRSVWVENRLPGHPRSGEPGP